MANPQNPICSFLKIMDALLTRREQSTLPHLPHADVRRFQAIELTPTINNLKCSISRSTRQTANIEPQC